MDAIITGIADAANEDLEMLDGLDASEVAETVMELLLPLGGEPAVRNTLAADVASIVMGSAIEVAYTLGAYAVEADITDEDDLIVTVDGMEVMRHSITFVDTTPALRRAA